MDPFVSDAELDRKVSRERVLHFSGLPLCHDMRVVMSAWCWTALSTYNAAFDYNGDGVINASDKFMFKQSQSISFLGLAKTI